MATNRTKSIAHMLHTAQVAIDNTLTVPVIQTAVANFGYDPGHMTVGRGLLDSAEVAVKAQAVAAGAQRNATQQLLKTEKEAFAAYQGLAQVARAVYAKTPSRLVTLGLTGKMPRSTGPFLVAAYKLFDNAPLKAELADYGYTAEKLADERARIAAYEQANLEQEAAKGAAQHATQHQNAALKAMNDWVSQYLKVARVALRGQPQLLNKIGIKGRSGKTPAQRAAPRKAAETRRANREAAELED